MRSINIPKTTNMFHPNELFNAVANAIGYEVTDTTAADKTKFSVSQALLDKIKDDSLARMREEAEESEEFADFIEFVGAEGFYYQIADELLPEPDEEAEDTEDDFVVKMEDGGIYEYYPEESEFPSSLEELFEMLQNGRVG